MEQFIHNMREDINKEIQLIELEENNVFQKSINIISLLESAFDKLKEFVSNYSFKSQADEIIFFKETKPQLFSILIYHRKIYNLEMRMPTGSHIDKKNYLEGMLARIKYFFDTNAWYLPGGKIDKEETSKEALIREIKEELDIDLQPDKIENYKHISAPAYGESTELIMEQDTFRYDLTEKIQPSREIAAVKFFDLEMYKQEPAQVSGVLKVFALLKEDCIIS